MADKKEKVRDKLIADCFGNVAGGKHCYILTEDMCLYGKCSFYKTREQFEADRKKYSSRGRAPISSMASSAKRIQCVNNGAVFPSIRSAARELSISEACISLVLKGRQKSTHGLTFRYL